MDFAALCPEINSGLMYNGPGSGPMMAAATAWKSLAAELDFTASAYQAVVSGLIGAPWLGPASASMAAAAAPYVEWIRSTAAAAEHAAAQATASAAAFETAFAMTVPPPVIAANRALLAGLIATNILGQNTPAIMATEAQYMEMWAQDAAAMYGYAGSSASHATLNCLTSPASTTNPGGLAGQAVAVTCAAALGISDQGELSGPISTLPSTMQGLASALTGPGGSGIMTGLDSFLGIPFVSNAVNGMVNSAALFTYNGIANAVLLGRAVAGSGPAAAAEVVGADSLADGLSQTVRAAAPGTGGSAGFGATPVWAAAGRASSVGGLSVPASWSAATSASRAGAVTLTVAGWTAASDSESMSIVPAGMPSVASATRGVAGLGAPRYGSKPTVIPRPLGIG